MLEGSVEREEDEEEDVGSGSKQNWKVNKCAGVWKMTDSPFLSVTVKQRENKLATSWLPDQWARLGLDRPRTRLCGLTRKGWFALSYGSCAVCKVEKNPRKTKVYEWLNSPVAC